MGPYPSPGWSDLPTDLLIRILLLLELPEALAFRAVCPSWCSASMAAPSVPPGCTPWLVSLATEPLPGGEHSRRLWDPTVTSKFRNLLDEKEFKGYADQGNVIGYRYKCLHGGNGSVYDMDSLGRHFYDKVVLSGSPSAGPAVALAIHLDGKRLSFARVGDTSWRQVSVIRRSQDSFADCVYLRGRFYVLSMTGKLKIWDLGGPEDIPRKKTIIAEEDDDFFEVITKYLVPTPWGHLLQIRVILDKDQDHCISVHVDRLDRKSCQMVGVSPATALRGHAALLGQNSPGLLSVEKFPELTPRLRGDIFERRCNQWKGVKVYDLKKLTLEDAFPSGGGHYGTIYPSEVWFMPGL
ncbi:hypothetical protein TRIUR3_21522 [Triticum urartu]|uniref:Uncharacterized protein n=1 Tax=Triticum urartu TaxID=4572 RepID=M8ADP0_TRIUA|nr:hypothetical protein TRIUR3_21522 [Triticum urartu]